MEHDARHPGNREDAGRLLLALCVCTEVYDVYDINIKITTETEKPNPECFITQRIESLLLANPLLI